MTIRILNTSYSLSNLPHLHRAYVTGGCIFFTMAVFLHHITEKAMVEGEAKNGDAKEEAADVEMAENTDIKKEPVKTENNESGDSSEQNSEGNFESISNYTLKSGIAMLMGMIVLVGIFVKMKRSG